MGYNNNATVLLLLNQSFPFFENYVNQSFFSETTSKKFMFFLFTYIKVANIILLIKATLTLAFFVE